MIDIGDLVATKAADFGDHENMTSPRIQRWINQFGNEAQLAARILTLVKYFGAANLRGMTTALLESCLPLFEGLDENKIHFVPVGEPGGGSSYIARILRQEKTARHAHWHISDLISVYKTDASEIEMIIFIDDFSGTGTTLSEWWEQSVEPLLSEKNARIVTGLLVLNHLAEEKLKTFCERTIFVKYLEKKENIFSEENDSFSPAEKRAIHGFCRRTNCADDYLEGFGKCGLLIAFMHGCPNNSLPVLWHDRQGYWRSLFNRKGI